jgi:hypothetical protein
LYEKDPSERYVPTDHDGLIRDTETKAVLASDVSALQNHRKKREILKKQKDKLNSINNIKEDVDELKADISEIKNLLHAIMLSNKD